MHEHMHMHVHMHPVAPVGVLPGQAGTPSTRSKRLIGLKPQVSAVSKKRNMRDFAVLAVFGQKR